MAPICAYSILVMLRPNSIQPLRYRISAQDMPSWDASMTVNCAYTVLGYDATEQHVSIYGTEFVAAQDTPSWVRVGLQIVRILFWVMMRQNII
jgi:hypothetical protein